MVVKGAGGGPDFSTAGVHSDVGGAGCTSESVGKSKNSNNKKPKPELAEADRGQLASVAASVLMKVLYAARLARFDLLRATCRLACYIAKWDKECDRRLSRLIGYIQSTLAWRQVGYIGYGFADIKPHIFCRR